MKDRSREIGVAIIGGGQGCLELFHLFEHLALEEFRANVLGVADCSPDAPGLQYALHLGKVATQDFADFYHHPELELLIELTGDNQVLEKILATKPSHVKVIDHVGARLFWDLMKLQSDQQARSILNSTRDAYIVIGKNDLIIHCNRAAEKMFPGACWARGLTPAPDFLQAVFGIQGLRILGREPSGSFTLPAYPGQPGEFPAEVTIFKADIDEQDCLVLSIRDCSEGYQAQQQISRLQLYEALFNNIAGEFAFSRDWKQSIQYTMQAVGEALGVDAVTMVRLARSGKEISLEGAWFAPGYGAAPFPERILTSVLPFISGNIMAGNMITLHNADIVPEPDRSAIIGKGIKSLLGFPIENQGRTWGGVFVHSRISRFWSGEDINFLLTIINIAQSALQRQEAQKSLRETQYLYQAVVDNSLTGVYFIEEGRFQLVNQRMADLFGYTQQELLGRNPLELALAEDRHLLLERMSAQIPHVIYNFRGVKKNGEVLWLECLDSEIKVRGKKAILGNLMDITERMKIEETRNHLFEALTLLAVGMVEQRDPYTAGHQRRVADISVAIGRKMSLSPFELEGLRFAAMLHDIGKISVPIEILTKPGKLRPSEMQIIQLHCSMGADILADVPFPWDIASIVLQHHERMDGSGYPGRLQGDEIRLESRILAVADVVEAMSSHRPYRASLGLQAAMHELINNKGNLYDPQVVNALQGIVHELSFQ